VTRSIEQENLGLGALGENVLNALIVGASVHVLDGDGDVQGRRQGYDVYVIGFFVHRFDFLIAKVLDAAPSIDKIDVEIRVLLQLTGRDETQKDDEIIREALIVKAADEIAVDGRIRGLELLDRLDEGVVEILDGELRKAQRRDEQIFHVSASLFESLAFRGGGRGVSLGEEEILEVSETEGTEKAVAIAASPA